MPMLVSGISEQSCISGSLMGASQTHACCYSHVQTCSYLFGFVLKFGRVQFSALTPLTLFLG